MRSFEERQKDWQEYLPTAVMLRSVLRLSGEEISELFDINDDRAVRFWFRGERTPRDPDDVISRLREMDQADTDSVGWYLDNLESFTDPAGVVYFDAETETVYIRYYGWPDEYEGSPEQATDGASFKRYRNRLERLHMALSVEGYKVVWLFRE